LPARLWDLGPPRKAPLTKRPRRSRSAHRGREASRLGRAGHGARHVPGTARPVLSAIAEHDVVLHGYPRGMRVLLSVVGTRGDVQPVIALALEVRGLGHEVRLCVSPNFVEWAQGLGFAATPVGIEMRAPRAGAAGGVAAARPIPDLITDQFDTVGAA